MNKIADVLTKILGLFSVNFEGFLIAGLFHAEVDKTCMGFRQFLFHEKTGISAIFIP